MFSLRTTKLRSYSERPSNVIMKLISYTFVVSSGR